MLNHNGATATLLPRQITAQILASVINSQHPRIALPTIAANHDLSLEQLQHLLKNHGYPDKQVMRKWWAKLLQDEDTDLDHAPTKPSAGHVAGPLTGWDRWKARRSAGDETVLAIEEAVTTAGYALSYRLVRGNITATSALEHIHKLGGTPLLAEVLAVVRSAWNDDPEAVTSGILQGLGHILTHYARDELDLARLTEALTGIVPRQLNARAAAVREVQKGTLDKLTAHVIIDAYNDVRRAGRVDPFFVRVKPLSPNKGTKRAADVERAAAVKTWALEQGLITSSKSYITKAIREAYDAAHNEGADA